MKKSDKLYLFGEINSETVREFVEDLHGKDAEGKSLTVYLCTEGGDHHYMLACYDSIRLAKADITMIGTGCVLSAGAFIFQAAKRRVLHRETRFMLHYGSGDLDKDFFEVSKRYKEVLFGRIREKNKRFLKDKFEDMMATSEHFSAERALELGLTDEVV